MISYTLKCQDGHTFDSWFQSASAFETLKDGGHLSCSVCGSGAVDKAVMSPRVSALRSAGQAKPAEQETSVAAKAKSSEMPEQIKAALQEMKRHVESNSDYVGSKFAQEARAMHLGDSPMRSIYGEANGAEAKALLEDGVPVMPLPFTPTKKVN